MGLCLHKYWNLLRAGPLNSASVGEKTTPFPGFVNASMSGSNSVDLRQHGVLDYYARRDADSEYEKEWGYTNLVAASYWRQRDELLFHRVLSRFDIFSRTPRVS